MRFTVYVLQEAPVVTLIVELVDVPDPFPVIDHWYVAIPAGPV